MAIRVINGLEFDGTCYALTFRKSQIEVLKISYADGLETEAVKAMGSQRQIARTPGTYKIDDVKITFRSSVFRAEFLPRMPKHGGGNIGVALTVTMTHPDLGTDSDLLTQARCTNWSTAVENSSKAIEVETTWQPNQIFWGTARRTVNNLAAGTALGGGKF